LPSAIQASKQLRIGSDIEYPPIEFFKEGTTEVQGLEVDLANALGDKLGVKFKFINDTDFAGIIGALLAQKLDPERALQYAVCLHGAAADALVARGVGPAGLTASEIAVEARAVLNSWTRAA
jgi:ABC-type phosphate/phosphonate transport system substrate-binding protein